MQQWSKLDCARWIAISAAVVVSVSPWSAAAQAPSDEEVPAERSHPALTLERALSLALEQNPRLSASRARLDEAEGARTTSEIYPHNPSVRVQVASRQGPDRRTTDYRVWLSQQVELAGQRRDRRAEAEAEVAAWTDRTTRAQRLLVAQVHLAFVRALKARDLTEVSRTDVELAQRLHDVAQRRLERGAGTQLDVNVTAAELGRAEARMQSALAHYQERRAELAEVSGLGAALLPTPEGDLRADLAAPPPLELLAREAREHRADLQALRGFERAGAARRELARSEAWPDLTLSAFVGREEGDDRLIGGRVSLPVPLFDRNQGAVQQAQASEQRARAERETRELSVEREVVAAHARYRAALQSAARLRELVLGTLEQNLTLLQRSFEAGKATWPEVIVIRRTLVGGQRELTAAEANARRAWIILQLAAGRMPVPAVSRGGSHE